ncbi:amino acid ABC transporter substrate-binding protein [Butyricicoccus pullicaecorum]|uniref:Amino acid ABC transporter substrate-binding protein n=1 Tax=Butyricicoccus pullicaecorum TaxID=501571 RepID=A0A1Y4LAD0_9FIRM|nr:ABC transporter substrate-binding protein [Butyricicoccus pullicaecorum]OUP51771.1 amino acid ABC transporter substrate-binding protein [Butyricicoccus pullicaecorum]
MKKALSLFLAAAMCAGMLAGCGGGADTNEATNGDSGESTAAAFKIGGTGPLTGDAAIYGNAVKNGAQLAVDEINAEGGVQFELKMEDDENDPEKAVSAYNALKDWGVQLSLGSVTSKPGEATATENFADRIFALTPSASAPAVTEGKDNVFQMCFSDPNQGTASAEYIADNQMGTKIAVIYKNDDVYSSGIYEKFKAEAETKGLNIVSTTTFTSSSATDFSVQLGEAKAAGADLLFLPIYYQPASLILQQAKSMGYAPKFFGVDGMDGILTLEGFDTSLAEGVMLLTPFNADAEDEKTQSFVTKYKEQFGDVPNQFAADAYDCVYAYKAAIEASGATPDMSAEELCDLMIQTFPTLTFDGLTGEGVTWDSTGAVSKSPKGMVIQNGAYVGM